MNKFLLLCLLSLSLSHLERMKQIVEKVNKIRTTWQAQEVTRDYRPFLGALLEDDLSLEERVFTQEELNSNLPETFDLRQAYPKCESIREIRDQANCGSCWAFGAAEAMSDRICIASGQKMQIRVSAQNILTCCGECGFGCQGGWTGMAWTYWRKKGIVSGGLYGDKKTCQPYFLPMCDHHTVGPHGPCPKTVDTPKCKKECQKEYTKKYEEDLTFGNSSYSISGEKKIMEEIYSRGSIAASFTVYEDFFAYKKGVYQHVTGSQLGGHAIKIIGWGVEKGTKYWLCANSWNDSWGDKGYFKILRGKNECGIERGGSAGQFRIKSAVSE